VIKILGAKNLIKITSLMMLLLYVGKVLAITAIGGTIKIESLFFDNDGGVFAAFSPAPSLCQGGARFRMHAKVLPSQANHDELVSGLLTAYTGGITLRYIWVSHLGGTEEPCSNSHYLQLHMIEYSPK
jgi:hypothetical protein